MEQIFVLLELEMAHHAVRPMLLASPLLLNNLYGETQHKEDIIPTIHNSDFKLKIFLGPMTKLDHCLN